jgi:hypothetical protein
MSVNKTQAIEDSFEGGLLIVLRPFVAGSQPLNVGG